MQQQPRGHPVHRSVLHPAHQGSRSADAVTTSNFPHARGRMNRRSGSYAHMGCESHGTDRFGKTGTMDVATALGTYLEIVDSVAPGMVEGLYVVGSFALDDWQPGAATSTSSQCWPSRPPKTISALAHRARAAQRAPTPAAHRRPVPRLGRLIAAPATGLHRPWTLAGSLHHDGECFEINPVTWYTLATYGVTVRGPAVDKLDIWHETEARVRFVIDNLVDVLVPARRLGREGMRGPDSSFDLASFEWCALGALRLHYTAFTGDVTSKRGAGEYGIVVTPDYMHDIIRSALEAAPERTRRGDDDDDARRRRRDQLVGERGTPGIGVPSRSIHLCGVSGTGAVGQSRWPRRRCVPAAPACGATRARNRPRRRCPSTSNSGSQKPSTSSSTTGLATRPSWFQVSISANSSTVPNPPGSTTKPSASSVEPRLAIVHGRHDLEAGQADVGDLGADQLLGDDADDLATGRQGGVGGDAHQPDVTTAVHEPDATVGQGRARADGPPRRTPATCRRSTRNTRTDAWLDLDSLRTACHIRIASPDVSTVHRTHAVTSAPMSAHPADRPADLPPPTSRRRRRHRARRQRGRHGRPPPRRPPADPTCTRCWPTTSPTPSAAGGDRPGAARLRRQGRHRGAHHLRLHRRHGPRPDHPHCAAARQLWGVDAGAAARRPPVPRDVPRTRVRRLAGRARPARATSTTTSRWCRTRSARSPTR